jgi:low temperature requirement protein LtrA
MDSDGSPPTSDGSRRLASTDRRRIPAADRAGCGDFHVKSGHFAERYGLFVIIALGEIVVAVGLAASGAERNVETTAAVAGAFVVVAVLWWAYFDWLAMAMERALAAVTGPPRSSAARDVFTLGHIPLIAGVVLYAVGAEGAVAHAANHLDAPGRVSLALGIVSMVGAFAFLAFRSDRFVTWERIAAGLAAAAAILGLRSVNGGVMLWVVAAFLGTALVLEKWRISYSVQTRRP